MSGYREYSLRLDNNKTIDFIGDSIEDIKRSIEKSQKILNDGECGGRIVCWDSRDDSEKDVLIFEKGGHIRAHKFVFSTNSTGEWEWIEFKDIYSALDYAKQWYEEILMKGPADYRGAVIARWMDYADDWQNYYVWNYICPDEKTIYYTTDGWKHWTALDYVPNSYSDLFACLMDYDLSNDTVYSKFLRPGDITTIRPNDGEQGEVWDDPNRFEDMLKARVYNDLPKLTVEAGLSLREAMVFSIERYADLTTSEIAAYMSRLLGTRIIPQTVVRARTDGNVKWEEYINSGIAARRDVKEKYPLPKRECTWSKNW